MNEQECISIAREVCREAGWRFCEPIAVRKGIWNWTVTTNAQSIGQNARIVINRRSGKVVQKAFLPR